MGFVVATEAACSVGMTEIVRIGSPGDFEVGECIALIDRCQRHAGRVDLGAIASMGSGYRRGARRVWTRSGSLGIASGRGEREQLPIMFDVRQKSRSRSIQGAAVSQDKAPVRHVWLNARQQAVARKGALPVRQQQFGAHQGSELRRRVIACPSVTDKLG